MPEITADVIADLMQQHRPELMRFLRQRVPSREDAQDIIQETFIRYAEYVSDNPVENSRAFMFRVASNLATDCLRSQARRTYVDITTDEISSTLADTAPLPEQAVFSGQQMERLIGALSELPPKCRDVFIMLRLKGMSYAEVEAKLAISQTMILKYLTRALTHCREKLADDL